MTGGVIFTRSIWLNYEECTSTWPCFTTVRGGPRPTVRGGPRPRSVADHGPRSVADHGPRSVADHGPRSVADHGPTAKPKMKNPQSTGETNYNNSTSSKGF